MHPCGIHTPLSPEEPAGQHSLGGHTIDIDWELLACGSDHMAPRAIVGSFGVLSTTSLKVSKKWQTT